MSSSTPNTSPSDIITYIGVPLAVISLLPILYNTIATLVSLHRIKQMLQVNHARAKTHNDILNRTIEVSFPRYRVLPEHPSIPGSSYGQLAQHPSKLEGGSWTIFEWQKQIIGKKTQRVLYPDELRQPQAEIEFEVLVSYLYGLGAIPDDSGWRQLRADGVWVRRGESLMSFPGGGGTALVIASVDDSDGLLSVAATPQWSSMQLNITESSISPYAVVLPSPAVCARGAQDAAALGLGDEDNATSKVVEGDADDVREKSANASGINLGETLDSIVCTILKSGVHDAFEATGSEPCATKTFGVIDVEHLLATYHASNAMWFASAVTAYDMSNLTVTWKYVIPNSVQRVAKGNVVPCGVLVLLGFVKEEDIAQWSSKETAGRRSKALAKDSRPHQHIIEDYEARLSKADRVQQALMEQERRLKVVGDPHVCYDDKHADIEHSNATKTRNR